MSYIIVTYSIKIGITTLIIYSTITLGVWGDGKQVDEFYLMIQKLLQNNEETKKGLISNLSIMKFKIFNVYNQTVFTTMQSIVDLPVKINNLIKTKLHDSTSELNEKKK
ncbi:PREDICTED: uncharacterized protein LOC105361146 [Ceratosolen solmsi marchali]|uniref:MICOS complex subunit MIC13 n=1 Tax=Ceratosolen solmsi marchali TaxID=326594 RepID=A0AAJ6YEG2_9HYME|nr:PREDICTED: uncharacterized protein LOC105361146 [Ceratosolen solmsi marchali]